MTKRVLILGASGMAGRHSGKAFSAAGWDVHKFDRQTENMRQAAQGCDVIVNAMNPPGYHDWGTILPKITRDVIDAARATGATVILPGNVYHFGDESGVWSETTIAKPVCRKGKIRLDIENQYRTSGVQTIVLRAGNFIDPDGTEDVLSLLYLRSIKRGKLILPGPPDARQAMCHIGDWARAAAHLAQMRDELGRFEDIPFPGYTLTGHGLKQLVEARLKRPVRTSPFPWWIFELASPIWEFGREMAEMRYLYATDHSLCDRRFNSLLPDFQATAVADAVNAKLAAMPVPMEAMPLPTGSS